jgi:phage terminase large subunit
MKIQTTKVFEDLIENDHRVCVFQGSSRASKTYNILIYWVYKLLNEDNKILSIVRKTLPSLKGSVLRDLKEVLILFNVYDPSKWHVSDGYYELGTNIIEWFSCDDETKLRGRKRDYLFLNEATEIAYDEYVQLLLRTSDRITIDFNPSLWKSWIYELEGKDDVLYTITTYKDNPFLPQVQVDEIEKLKDKDPNLWRVFGLGQKGVPTRVVFTHQQFYGSLPDGAKLLGYGIDFGYNDPSVLAAVYKMNDNIYCQELLYLKNITIPDFIYKIKDIEGINFYDDFICDSANPQAIEEMRRNGLNAKPVKKDTILSGIDQIKRNNFYVHVESKNLMEELQTYVWKNDKNGNNLDEPEDKNNHLLDAIRYVLQMKAMRNTGVYVY